MGGEYGERERRGYLAFARILGQILNAYNSKTVRARTQYSTFCSNFALRIYWNGFRDDRTKDNEVSELDRVIGQRLMGNYWDRQITVI